MHTLEVTLINKGKYLFIGLGYRPFYNYRYSTHKTIYITYSRLFLITEIVFISELK